MSALNGQQAPEVTANLRVLVQRHIPAVTLAEGEEPPASYQRSFGEYYYWSPQGYRPIDIGINEMSDVIRYAGPSKFILYSRSDVESPDGEATYVPRMGCSLPLGQGGDYFLVGLDESNSGLASLQALPVNPERIPVGEVLAYNLGSVALKLATKDQTVTLQPRKGALVNIPQSDAVQFQIMAAVQEDEDYKLVYRRRWTLKKQGRALCLFYPTNTEMTRWNSRLVRLD